ncbi:DEAD/DEAH box helicase [Lysinibacillus sp. 54212]|uniref:DEAD/DEAH box helicase n=1 Tax=Lysinibacillus sp. 54212 TaxID=3119829 RepID=UPI002FCCB2D0
MDIKINNKKIKEMCGSVSFKRGEAYVRAGKVTISEDSEHQYRASVKGAEDFQVTIEKDSKGRIQTSCSCPTLENFSMSCQHVAAVLLAIDERKRQGISHKSSLPEVLEEQQLSQGIMTLFQDEPIRKSRHQSHFEERKVLDITFTLKPCMIGKGQYLFGIKPSINLIELSSIREFLLHVQSGTCCLLSPTFHWDPNEYCFSNEAHEVLQRLIEIVRDEEAFLDAIYNDSVSRDVLLIPPSAWRGLMPLLTRTLALFVEHDGHASEALSFVDRKPPLQFLVDEVDGEYRLTMKGFERMLLFGGYHAVLCDGFLYQLNSDDCKRLTELQRMVDGSNGVPIPHDQLDLFLNKIVPGLRKIGDVTVAQRLIEEQRKTPLVAKLYLDRLKNRLLAGLEFHYEHVVIQPLENAEHPVGPIFFRDYQKEQEILEAMEESGFTKTDGGYFMQNEELEYSFLYYTLPKLQPLTQIYATTAVRNRLVKKNSFPKIAVKLKKERTNWLQFKFEMDGISNQQVKEILEALEMKMKYYRLPNDSLLSLETKEMEEIRRFLLAGPVQDDDYESTLTMPILESLKFLELIGDSEVFTPEESFRQFVSGLMHPERLDFEVPPSLEGILRDYQKQGFQWMKGLASYGFGGVLADDMGLGKTVQSIAFIVSEIANIRARKQPVLIVCPSSLTYNWLHEIMQFAPELQGIVIDGDVAVRRELQQNLDDIDVLITSYPLLRQDLAWYEKQTFYTVFFDEAQAFKNPMTQTARAVKKLKAEYRFGLTGTPVENNQEELWSIYHVIFPQLFQGLQEYSHLTRKAISRRVRPFLLRRLKEDVLPELPGKNETLDMSELLPEQKGLYAALLAKLRVDTLKHLDKDTFRKNKIRILAGITRLRQICCHPSLFVEGYTGSSAKFEALLQILEESRLSRRRVLIFSQFTKMLDLIGRDLTARGQAYFYLDGQTPSEERVVLCNRFNSGERDVFLISLKAGGTGLNLTGADTVILYDLWWNPAVEAQAADRAYRMGQQNTVEVIKLIARGTIEEKMNELQEKKRNLIADILETDGKASGALTEDDIREILRI